MTENNNCQDKKKWLDTCGRLISLLLAICGTATAIFAYHASLNANEISRRSFENAELSAQPIISGYIDADSSLTINIQKGIPRHQLRERNSGNHTYGRDHQ